MKSSRTGIATLLASALALVVGGLLVHELRHFDDEQPASARVIPPDRSPLGEFHLIQHSGQPFGLSDLRGKWTFLYFGYSSCLDVCPATLGQLNRVQQLLASQKADDDTAYVFVSVDPQRDTPARLSDYLGHFNPKFQGVTGDSEQLSKLARPLQISYQRTTRANHLGDYGIDHSSIIALIDPAGRPRALFPTPQSPEQLVAEFLRIRAAGP